MGVGINFYPPAARSREWSSAGWLATNGGKTTIYWDRDGGRWWHKKKTRETKEETEENRRRLRWVTEIKRQQSQRDRLSKEQCLKILHIPSISFTALTVRDFVSCRMRLPSNVAHKDSFDHIWQSVPLSLSPPIPLPSALYATRFSMSLTHCSLIKHLVPLSFYHLSPHISLSRQFTPSTSLSHIHHLGCFGFPPPSSYCPCVPPLPRSVALFLYHFASIQFDSIQVALLNLMFDERFLLKHTID